MKLYESINEFKLNEESNHNTIKMEKPKNENQKAFTIHNVVCSACGEEIPEHEKDISLLAKMSQSELVDLECISCEMKFRDSADIDMFGG